MDHRMVRTGSKSRRLESQGVKTGSVAVDQFPVAKESQNQAETTTFRFAFHFNRLNTEDAQTLSHWPINVKSCRTRVRHLNSFIVRNGHQYTALFQNDPTEKEARFRLSIPELVSRNLQWSPSGSYLLSMMNRSILIYGGDGSLGLLPPIMGYKLDAKVERVDFSPGEKYIVGYSRPESSNTKELWLKIFDVSTGRLVTGLDGHVADAGSWPVIRWAGGKEDKYFATLSKNNVYVYETETFKPMDVDDDDVVDISWSPTESILALWKLTKIVLLRIPEKKILIQKDIINVSSSDCKMYWQSNGKYLAVQVNSVFELFCFKEDGSITTESLEVDGKFIAFAWEPNGHRFAVIHGEDQSKPRVSFYSMETRKMDTLEDKQADTLFWSPRGKQIVLADLNSGHLEFFDVDKLKTTNKALHLMVNVVAWDPTGRYVATAVTIDEQSSVYRDPEIDGFKMWSLHGEFLYSVPSEDYRLLQVEWRPYGGIIDNDGMPVEEDSEEDDEYSEAEEDRDYIWEVVKKDRTSG